MINSHVLFSFNSINTLPEDAYINFFTPPFMAFSIRSKDDNGPISQDNFGFKSLQGSLDTDAK